jgi:predicted DNA-binding transcriptional regulator AlpA
MQVLTFEEAAKRASLTRRSIERLLSIGEGPAIVSLGKRRRGILDLDLDQWLIGRRVPAPGESADHPHKPAGPR